MSYQQDLFIDATEEPAASPMVGALSELLTEHHAGDRLEDVPYVRLAWAALSGSAQDIRAGLDLDDPFARRTAETANNMLLAIDWFNDDADAPYSIALAASSLGLHPRYVRRVLADFLDLRTRGVNHLLCAPDWLPAFVQAIPRERIDAACKDAAEDRLTVVHNDQPNPNGRLDRLGWAMYHMISAAAQQKTNTKQKSAPKCYRDAH